MVILIAGAGSVVAQQTAPTAADLIIYEKAVDKLYPADRQAPYPKEFFIGEQSLLEIAIYLSGEPANDSISTFLSSGWSFVRKFKSLVPDRRWKSVSTKTFKGSARKIKNSVDQEVLMFSPMLYADNGSQAFVVSQSLSNHVIQNRLFFSLKNAMTYGFCEAFNCRIWNSNSAGTFFDVAQIFMWIEVMTSFFLLFPFLGWPPKGFTFLLDQKSNKKIKAWN